METGGFWEVSRGIFQVLWLVLYWYYIGQAGTMEKGAGRRAIAVCLTGVSLGMWVFFPAFFPLCLSWFCVTVLMLLYDLFFDGEPFRHQWWRIGLPGMCLAAGGLVGAVRGIMGAAVPTETVFLVQGPVLFLFLILLSAKRNSLQLGSGIMTGVSFLAISVLLWLLCSREHVIMEETLRKILLWGGALLELMLFGTVERTLYCYKKGFEYRTERFRTELMEHSYGEIREIYMDMRGWRHDYHNHMQVMKAQLALGNFQEIGAYLDKLEKELDRVDTLVKSGNLMTDAILNSKLTLARRQGIPIHCKAKMPENLSVEDVDLCVILGNLLDNAIEACAQVEAKDRFLRIYMAVNGSQFYLSVQNSAREEPDFEARNYITKKRGNHGLGMKRVKAAVDKYQGFLNLANEPGIFAAEVTMPLN